MKKIKIIENGMLDNNKMMNTRGGQISCDNDGFIICNTSKSSFLITECLMHVTCPMPFTICTPSVQKYFICDNNNSSGTYSGAPQLTNMKKSINTSSLAKSIKLI